MDIERVHFYSKYDLSVPIHVDRMSEVVEAYGKGKQPEDINDYLEMFHIVQFLEHGVYPTEWDEKQITCVKQYKSKIAAFFSQIKPEELPLIYRDAGRDYGDTIWLVIDTFKIKGLITEVGLRGILEKHHWRLKDLLEHQWIVEKNSVLLTKLLKENEHTAEWLLEKYVEDDPFGTHLDLFFPKSLSITDKDEIIRKYINSDKASLHYVRLVLVSKRSAEFSLLPLTIKAAKIKEQVLNQAILSYGSIPVASYGVALTEDFNAPTKQMKVNDDGRTMFVYNKNTIDACNDATIVYYCSRVFEFTEREYGFITLISKDAETDEFERITGVNAQNTYHVDFSFRMKESLAQLQFLALSEALADTHRTIESVIKTFYEEFLKTEYGYESLPLTLPKKTDEPILKIRSLAIEMDSVEHQFNCYVENGVVDKDLIELTPPGKLTATKSLISHRYCTLNKENEDVRNLLSLFFGSQSMLTFVEPCKDSHFRNYYELLEKQIEVKYEDYQNYQKLRIGYLLEKAYLVKDENNVLHCTKMTEVKLLKHLYEYGACSYWAYPKEERAILDEMFSKGWVVFDNHLFTPAEQDYFSYYLNNEKFTNGLAIRNNYAHGTTPSYSEEKHQHNYLQLLVLFVLLLLKISEDLDMKRYLGKYGLE